MFARISAKALILVAAAALVFFGVGLLGLALAASLVAVVGNAGADAIAGGILLVPVLVWGLVVAASRPVRRPALPPAPPSGIVTALFGAIAKETPWIAIVGAGLAGAAEMFLNRNRSKPKN